jgi:hypothetical protein
MTNMETRVKGGNSDIDSKGNTSYHPRTSSQEHMVHRQGSSRSVDGVIGEYDIDGKNGGINKTVEFVFTEESRQGHSPV